MATIKDVAAAAGVSFTTVSHVVNNTRPVSAEVRAKVEAAIGHLNYVPSGIARSLKARATSTVGVLVPNSTNPYFAELSRGIEDLCARRGYSVILCNSDDDPAKQRKYLRVLAERRIDGMIFASAGADPELADSLRRLAMPVVIVDREVDAAPQVDLVEIDHDRGAYLATRHLLDLGHRRIACIGGPRDVAASIARIRGYRRALEEAGIVPRPSWVVESDFSSSGGHRAATVLLDAVAPTALFASNDMMGIGALRAVAERGLRVPHDVSVIGFDDIQLSRYVYPALTTVGQSILQLGEMAAETLLERVSRSELGPARRLVVQPALALRESTARVRERVESV